MSGYEGMFKARYDLKGRADWVRLLTPEDREVFIRIGLAAADYGRKGGKARAATAARDEHGRFAKEDK